MRLVFVFLFSFMFIYADNLENKSVMELYRQNYYSYICMHRWIYINKYNNKNEKLLSLVAYSCLKKHYLTPALDLSKVLRKTEMGRTNALYINTLYSIKLMLIKYICDNYDINSLKLPKIEDSLLAKVFYLAQKQKPAVKDFSFKVKDKKYTYSVTYKEEINNIIIDVLNNGQLLKKEKYW